MEIDMLCTNHSIWGDPGAGGLQVTMREVVPTVEMDKGAQAGNMVLFFRDGSNAPAVGLLYMVELTER